MRILIAEDDFASRILLDAVLIKWGYEVVTANDGEEAWTFLQADTGPAIAIVDWMMPRCSGVELCRRVRAQPRELVPYILMLTAKGQKADSSEGLDAGADDYLVKPFDLAELGARLRVARRAVTLQRELIDSRKAVAYQAVHDVASGALNRGAALEALSTAVNSAVTHSVLLIAVDQYKQIQQQQGAQCAEAVVRRLVQSARHAAPEAQIGRYSADELVVILPSHGLADGLTVAELIRSSVTQPAFSEQAGIEGLVTVSVGLAEWDHEASVELLLCYADTALYAARSRGNTIDVFSMSSSRQSAE